MKLWFIYHYEAIYAASNVSNIDNHRSTAVWLELWIKWVRVIIITRE